MPSGPRTPGSAREGGFRPHTAFSYQKGLQSWPPRSWDIPVTNSRVSYALVGKALSLVKARRCFFFLINRISAKCLLFPKSSLWGPSGSRSSAALARDDRVLGTAVSLSHVSADPQWVLFGCLQPPGLHRRPRSTDLRLRSEPPVPFPWRPTEPLSGCPPGVADRVLIGGRDRGCRWVSFSVWPGSLPSPHHPGGSHPVTLLALGSPCEGSYLSPLPPILPTDARARTLRCVGGSKGSCWEKPRQCKSPFVGRGSYWSLSALLSPLFVPR